MREAAGGGVLLACALLLALLVRRIACEHNDTQLQLQDELFTYNSKDSLSNFTEFTRNYGYYTEEHVVITKDGYILFLFRIPKGKNCNGSVKEPPILLMHGLLMSADSWLDAGPSSGLAFLLADACYDTWVGNMRGNYYGRRHVNLDPDTDSEFWDFNTEEMGVYDLPATIDYVLEHTDSNDIMYVGFSQGCRILFTMASETSGYVEKIRIAINVAPAVRVKYTRSISIRLLTQFYALVSPILKKPRQLEVLQKGGLIQTATAFVCKDYNLASTVCQAILAIIDSYDPGSVTTDTIRTLFGHFPAGTSAYTLAFYGQGSISKKFQKYDYGLKKNLQLYGSVVPPLYNLKKSTMPIVLIYGNNDFLVDPRDVRWLSNQLPNVLERYEVSRSTWNHLDNNYSQFSKQLIFPKINQYLSKYSSSGNIS
ncbi:PREDICTED: lipase member J-like [Papilio xuthus]|uniref:Lipase n=1 Tax=Papilio xuthus TaxID=66420 RepID=A0AAJ6Z5B4_PAPXU|nr:PREDICTED: lipase member J-like [Papilio xuthus]